MTNGNEVEQQSFDGTNTQKWIFTHIGDNVYTIRSTQNISYYLGISGDSTEDETPIVLRTGTVTNGMKWRVENGNQGYKIVSYSDPTMVLCTGTASATAGNDLKLSDFQSGNNSYQDEWELHEKRDYTLMYIGEEVGDPLMPPILDAVSSALETNAGMSGYGYTSITKNNLLVHLSSTSVFSCITHGDTRSILVADGYLYISDINSLSSTAFNDLRFVHLGACYTGNTREGIDNLVDAVYNKGADAVLGFEDVIFVNEANLWTQVFMTELTEGVTLAEAMSVADSVVKRELENELPYISTNSVHRYLVGSEQLIPCP